MSERFTGYDHDATTLAGRLLGQRLVHRSAGHRCAGIIVEVEAYLGAEDRAAHTYGGRRTARNASMYLAGGHAYVYRIYGIHHCLNVVGGVEDEGVAVLIRALEPTEGVDLMARRRGVRPDDDRAALALCSGPGRLTQALGIDRGLDGVDLRIDDALWIERVRKRAVQSRLVERTPRIGVGYAGDWADRPLRFHVRDHPSVSR